MALDGTLPTHPKCREVLSLVIGPVMLLNEAELNKAVILKVLV